MAADPSLVVRVAANLAELKRNLSEGKNQVETTTAAMQRLSSSFQGDKIIQAAHNVTAAVNQIGGASKLTEAEQARVNRTVEAALEKYRALGTEAPRALQELAAATRSAEKPLISMSGILQGVVAGASAAVTARLLSAGSALASFGAESIARGAQMQSLGASFERLAGGAEQARYMLNFLRTGALGLVDDMSLMQSSNKAMLLGLGLSATQMGELARTATVLGRAMGQDATKSLDDLITALGRSSPMILDNLGLTVKVGEANEKYAQILGKTSAELTDAEKKQAFMNAAMDAARVKVEELGEVQLTATEHASKLWTMFRNLADASANLVVQNRAVNSQLGLLTDSMSTLEIAMREGLTAAYAYKAGLRDLEVPTVQHRADLSSLIPQIKGVALSEEALFAALEGTSEELERATRRVQQHENAIKGANIVWGEMGNIVRFQIAGVISPTLLDLQTGTTNAAQAMQDLRDQLARVGQQAIQIQPTLKNLAALPWVEFRQSVQQTGTETDGFFARVFGGAEQMSTNLSSLFQSAFVGGGGALGAVKAFATQTLTSLFGMIPGIGEWAGALASVVVSTFSKLWGWISDGFKKLFGGASADELAGRELVAKFEDNVIAMLSDAQRMEAGTDRWRQVLVGVRDAVMAAGVSHDDALALVERLWASSKNGADASRLVIEEITRLMQGQGQAAAGAIDKVRDALAGLPDEIRVVIRGEYRAPDLPGEGFAAGTIARGSWFRDFGVATATVLHGREAVVTPQQAPAFARAVLGETGSGDIERLIRNLPREMTLAFRMAMQMESA